MTGWRPFRLPRSAEPRSLGSRATRREALVDDVMSCSRGRSVCAADSGSVEKAGVGGLACVFRDACGLSPFFGYYLVLFRLPVKSNSPILT